MKIDLSEFIPKEVICGKNQREYPIVIKDDIENYLELSYITNGFNNAKKAYSLITPRYVSKDNETFEVLGLLQAEMGKSNNGCIIFSNHEYQLINRVMKWFEKELEIMCDDWRGYIRVNINEPQDINYKKEIEEKAINHWLNKTKIDIDKKHPKAVTYIKNTENKRLRYYDYGTLMIEYKANLLSQIIKKFVRLMSEKVPSLDEEYIRGFMRGIIAGEGSVEVSKEDKKYRVHISAPKEYEKDLYWKCFEKLDIKSKKYKGDKLIISKRENNIKLLKQRLMTLSHEKYNKFLNMMRLYPGIEEETGYFNGSKVPWNKIPREIMDKIMETYYQNPNNPCWKIAEKVGVSSIKVNRVLREKELGKRRNPNVSEDKIKIVLRLYKENPNMFIKDVVEKIGVSGSAVCRIKKRYNLKEKFKFKTPKEKIDRIIQIYKENPSIKIKEICNEVGVSNSVVRLVRIKYNLCHLGYMHLVGNNNKSAKSQVNESFKNLI